jgi:hypothetical protein
MLDFGDEVVSGNDVSKSHVPDRVENRSSKKQTWFLKNNNEVTTGEQETKRRSRPSEYSNTIATKSDSR